MSDQRAMAAMLRPLLRRVSMMLARGTVALTNAGTKLQGLQMRLLAGEVKEGMEHFEAYGFTSNPLPGAEGIAAFFDGDRSHGVVLCVADRRYRLRGLESGEVAIYTDEGDKIVLKRGNIIEFTAATKVVMVTPLVEISGDVHVTGDVLAGTISLKTHVHSGVQGGPSNTGGPV